MGGRRRILLPSADLLELAGTGSSSPEKLLKMAFTTIQVTRLRFLASPGFLCLFRHH